MTETLAAFIDPEMMTILKENVYKHLKPDNKITYLQKKNIDEAIRQKLRKRDEYETDMNKIYNLIIGHTNEQYQEKAVSDATYQAVKTF